MRIAVLASGSKGNSTYVETNNTRSLIDVGMNNIYIERNLREIGIEPDSIQNIFITHTHTDHIAGLRVFVKKHKATVYLTSKMYEELKNDIKEYVIIDNPLNIEDLNVQFFKTSHDASDSVGYILTSIDKSLVYVTDTGYINNKNYDLLKNKDLYIFESNHDVKLLMDNPNYPYKIKQRILSDKGHLSNKDCCYYLSKFIGENTKNIILAHLSEQNNEPIIAYETLKRQISCDINVIIAEQNNKTEIIEL